jgi:hypothetical protein
MPSQIECATSTDIPKLGEDGSAPASTMALKTLGKRSREGPPPDEGSKSARNFGEAHVFGSLGSKDDILSKEEAGINRGYSLQTYPTSSNTAFPLCPGNSVAQGEWGMPSFSDPTATANFDTQFRTTIGEQQLGQAPEKFQPDQCFMLSPDL